MKRQSTEVVKLYRGTTEISKVYHGTSLYYDKDVHPDIPLEYIANGPDELITVNVGFDTGIDVATYIKNLKIEVKAAAYRTSGTNNICGAVRQNSWDGIAIYAFRNGEHTVSSRLHTTVITYSDNFTSNTPFVASTYYDTSDVNPNNSSQYRGKLIVDGQTTASSGYITVNSRNFNIIICGQNSMTSTDGTIYLNNNQSGVKTYYAKIWNGNTLIRNYSPVLHYINGQYVPSFYDSVNNNYIYNSGTDAPIYVIK
jgi:hypothetical protein